jgi:hypothetical protein
MNKQISLVILLAIAILVCASISSVVKQKEQLVNATEVKVKNSGQVLPITAKTEIDGETIELEVAQTPEQQAMGLMFRQSLPSNRGMLFTFNPAKVTRFWMKNMSISLDMIFLQQGEIKAIAANVPPCKADPCPVYGPDTAIDQVIELREGKASELNLAVGDSLKVEFLNTYPSH